MMKAEVYLCGDAKLSVFEICQVSGFSLQANIAASLGDMALKPILAVRAALADQFKYNIGGSLAKRRELALAWFKHPSNRSSLVAAAKDMAAKITSNVIIGLTKSR